MNPLAEDYVKLVLRVGFHDAGYVDAYYGPGEWAEEADATPGTMPELRGSRPRLCENAVTIIIVKSQLCGDPDEAIH